MNAKEVFSPDDYSGWLAPKNKKSNQSSEEIRESKEAWTHRQKDEDTNFAKKIMAEQPQLRIKQMLDARRKQSRWAISFHSAAKLLGIDPATLKKIVEDPYRVSLEQIRPLGNRGHRYIWLSDVLSYARHMSEPDDEVGEVL